MKIRLAAILLLALPAAGATHKDAFPVPCGELWAAVLWRWVEDNDAKSGAGFGHIPDFDSICEGRFRYLFGLGVKPIKRGQSLQQQLESEMAAIEAELESTIRPGGLPP